MTDPWPTTTARTTIPQRIPSPSFLPKDLGRNYLDHLLKNKPLIKEGYIATQTVIQNQRDILAFEQSPAFERLMNFLLILSIKVQGSKSTDAVTLSPAVQGLEQIIQRLADLADSIDPVETPQRYGNSAYRTWHSQMLLVELPISEDARVEIDDYFRLSFGNETRIDFGSGHELSFIAFLCCLDLIGMFTEEDYLGVMHLFGKYIELTRKLIVRYQLEPAGSKGVYGLDDYHFIAYMLGASQLIGHQHLKPSSMLNKDIVDMCKQDYMFFGCISFIHRMKTGPFNEHSPILYDISGIKKGGWEKVFRGLIKMYIGEVLRKVPVVQHFRFGRLLPFSNPPAQ